MLRNHKMVWALTTFQSYHPWWHSLQRWIVNDWMVHELQCNPAHLRLRCSQYVVRFVQSNISENGRNVSYNDLCWLSKTVPEYGRAQNIMSLNQQLDGICKNDWWSNRTMHKMEFFNFFAKKPAFSFLWPICRLLRIRFHSLCGRKNLCILKY